MSRTPRIIPTGERHGRLVVTIQRNAGERYVQCLCDCGQPHAVPLSEWGKTRSCGCFRREETIRRNTKHGYSGTSIYMTWGDMINRCTNATHKRWADYGGRGITVCERWRKFENFLADMGDRPEGLTLDRIDNDGPYTTDNCRWATAVEQRHNRRDSRRYAA
ncbi:hypothetical protein ACIRQP_14765 [Streptomyces sp. NPDC102274]|uniref:hypothetical protein n=1 Tax=Streptomyces sp. NPDC102274 TaxID=3366151 RepID=UPI0037F5F1A1